MCVSVCMCSKFVCVGVWVGGDAETNRAPCGGGTTWHVKYVPTSEADGDIGHVIDI